jgi:polyhydroxyalkanoate synthesis regulator phasin
MIRFISQSLGMAVVAALFGTGVALTAARGQNGFVDDDSHVPPPPGGQMPMRSSYQTAQPVDFVPPAAVAYPPQSSSSNPLSPAYNLTPIPGATSRQLVAQGNFGAGKMTPRIGAYGIGGKRPDPRAAADTSKRVTPVTYAQPAPAATATARPTSAVKPAGHFDDISESAFPPSVPPPVGSMPAPLFPRLAAPLNAPGSPYPTERLQAPSILGSHLGLLPGETATERSIRLMNLINDRDHQIDGLSQRNSELSQMVKQRDDQLLLAIREIKSTRKEVQTARDELEYLRQQVKALQEKVHGADRDNAALIQTMAPLLQKLLESNNNSSNSPEE